MGSFSDLKSSVEANISGDGDKLQPGNFQLASQSSLFSLKFDELQYTFSGLGKDFGSMNMEELLKNLWSAEEGAASMTVEGEGAGTAPNGTLQKQGSLTLPRILGQKTVDEVWTNLLNEDTQSGTSGAASETNGSGVSNVQQREQTKGEMTLEEFLMKAGVVREETQQYATPGNNGFYGQSQLPTNKTGFMANRVTVNNMVTSNNPPSLTQNIGELSSYQQHRPLFPKQANVAFASPMNQMHNSQLANPMNALASLSDPAKKKGLVQGGGGLQSVEMSIAGLGKGVIKAAPDSPMYQVSPDVIGTNTSSLSPASYVYNPGTRGRKSSGGIEKVVERRHRRMIKNRESAARSRARKQAYTLELEAEIAVLKEKNEELQKKQAEIIELQKKQQMEEQNQPYERKRVCLRRTLTGPW